MAVEIAIELKGKQDGNFSFSVRQKTHCKKGDSLKDSVLWYLKTDGLKDLAITTFEIEKDQKGGGFPFKKLVSGTDSKYGPIWLASDLDADVNTVFNYRIHLEGTWPGNRPFELWLDPDIVIDDDQYFALAPFRERLGELVADVTQIQKMLESGGGLDPQEYVDILELDAADCDEPEADTGKG